MNEIERAIAEINTAQEPSRCVSLVSGARISKEWISVASLELAEKLLRTELEREKNPLTCDGCDNKDKFDYSREVGRQCPCTHCKRIAPDRYEPKGESK